MSKPIRFLILIYAFGLLVSGLFSFIATIQAIFTTAAAQWLPLVDRIAGVSYLATSLFHLLALGLFLIVFTQNAERVQRFIGSITRGKR